MPYLKTCIVCGDEFEAREKSSRMHPSCIGQYNKALRNGDAQPLRFEPQGVRFAPAAASVSNPMAQEPAAVVAQLRASQPPCAVPEGRPWNDLRNNPRFNQARREVDPEYRGMAPFRSAVYDLETTDLNGQIGRILCGVILVFDPEELYVFRADAYDAWKQGHRSDDREITGDILSVLEACDVHYAHNGRWFDQKFLATRAIAHNFRPVTPQKLVDPCQKARTQFALASNSLDSVADHFGIPMKKTPFESNIWAKAMLDGDAAAMEYIVEHCVIDVYVLAQVARRISPWVKQIDTIGSFR